MYPTQTPALKMTVVAQRSTTKILCGDWPWHPNRGINDPHDDWHNYKGKRWMNMLFVKGFDHSLDRFP